MIKECIVCGKEFEPYYALAKRQMCCSKECSRVHNSIRQKKQYKNDAEYRAKRIKQCHKYNETHRSIKYCKICRKLIEQDYGRKSQMHYECIIDACVKILSAGETINHLWYNRLQSCGYTIAELKEEYADEIGCNEPVDWQDVMKGFVCVV